MTMTEIDLPSSRAAIALPLSQATAVEQARAVAEVAAAVQVAQQNPRDITRSLALMREACRTKAPAGAGQRRLDRASCPGAGPLLRQRRPRAAGAAPRR